MTKRIKKTRLKPRVEKFFEDTGFELAGSYEALYEEVDLPIKASETAIATLYKYRPIGEQIIRNDGTTATQDVVNILKNCKLYAATPDELNDPFEVTLPAGNADLEKYRHFMNHILEEFRWTIPNLKDQDWFPKIKNDQNLDIVQEAILKLLENQFRKVRILSLTSKNNDPLMWSHYAAGHNGVCLGFRVMEGNIFGEALEVQYKKPPIYYTLGNASLGRMKEEAIMTKMKDWSYEEEWRVIVSNYINPAAIMSNLPFKPKWITKIIFGLRVDEKVKSTLVAAASHVPEISFGYVQEISASGELAIEWGNDSSHKV